MSVASTETVRALTLRLPCSPDPTDGLPAVAAVRLGFGDRVRMGDVPRDGRRTVPSSALPYRTLRLAQTPMSERDVAAVELENEHLRALFLPGFGGRLWSFVDKTSGRELLAHPEGIELVVDGLRGAWFAGGIEWNLGRLGHWPLTASRVGAGVVRSDGGDSLRLWAWERQTRSLWRLDATLPAGSRTLHVVARVTSHADREQELTWRPAPGSPDTQAVQPGETVLWVTTLTSDGERLEQLTAATGQCSALPGTVPAVLDHLATVADQAPTVLQQPDGWGRVEVAVGHLAEDPAAPLLGAELTDAQRAWLRFAEVGELTGDLAKWPQTGDAWEARLARSEPGWERELLIGAIRCADGDVDSATRHWEASLAHSLNGPALHCLAVTTPDSWDSYAFAERAHEADPWDDDLLVAYLQAPKTPPRVVLRVVERLPQDRREHPEVRKAVAAALRALGRSAEADKLSARQS